MDSLIQGVLFFSGGTVFGWLIRGYIDKIESGEGHGRMITFLVSVIWSISVLAEIFLPVFNQPNYQTPIFVHIIMGTLNGLFAKDLIQFLKPTVQPIVIRKSRQKKGRK